MATTPSQMTDQELARAAREHDRGANEGGEGYNPYREEQITREMMIEAGREPTLDERRDALLRLLEARDSSLARESGTYDEAEIAAIRLALGMVEIAGRDEFAAAWTPQITQARRDEWNAWVRSQGARVHVKAIQAREAAQGWRMDDLKRAIKLHKLA